MKMQIKQCSLSIIIILVSPLLLYGQAKFELISKNDTTSLNGAYISVYRDSLYHDLLHQKFVEDNFKLAIPDSINCIYLYISSFQYKDYKKRFCRPFVHTETITLQPKSNKLHAVVIKGFKNTEITRKGSVVEFRPGKIITSNEALKTINVIKSLPEVFVLPQGKIKLRGHEVKNIYLHSGSNLRRPISYSKLKNIDANALEKIEVDYLKSEIDVYLKKMKKSGYLFDNELDLTQGEEFYAGLDSDFKLERGRTYLVLNNSIGWVHKKPKGLSIYKSMINEGQYRKITTDGFIYKKQKYFNTSLYIEHDFDSVYTVGAQVYYSINEFENKNNTSSIINEFGFSRAKANRTTNSHVFSSSFYLQGEYSNQWVLVMNGGWLTSLQKLNGDSDFLYNIDNKSINGVQDINQRLRSNGVVALIKVEKSLGDTKLSFVVTENHLTNETKTDYVQNLINQHPLDSTFTNKLSENKINIETSIKTTLWKDYFFKFSSSFIFYKFQNHDEALGLVTEKSLHKWLPQLSFSIPVKEKKYLTLFLNSYFRAPNFSNIIFKSSSSDGFVESHNNPFLKPYSSFQVGASYSFIKNLSSTFFYSTTDNMYMNYPYFSNNGAFLGNRKINLSENKLIGISLFYSNTLFERIFLSANINFNYHWWKNRGRFSFSTKFPSFLSNLSVYYSTDTDWSFNLDYTFSSGQQMSENISLDGYSLVNIAISKRLNQKWSIFCNINNILDTYNYNIYSDRVPYKNMSYPDALYFRLGVEYRIKKRFKRKKTKDHIMENMDNRLKIHKK